MASESSPLLGGSASDGTDSSILSRESHTSKSRSNSPADRLFSYWKRWRTFYLCVCFLLMIDVSGSLGIAPTMRLMEDLVCRDHYREHRGSNGTESNLCNVPEVQERLATLRGTLNMLEILPSFVLGIPYGIMADTRGPRFVLALAIIGAIMSCLWYLMIFSAAGSLPLWLIYVSPIFLWIGGGAFVIGAVLMAIVADAIPSESRTTIFFLLGILNLLTSVLVAPYGAWQMDFHSPLLIYTLTIPILFVPLLILFFTPRTISTSRVHDDDRGIGFETVNTDRISRLSEVITKKYHAAIQHLEDDIVPMFKSKVMLCGLFSMLVLSFSESSATILLQYMRVRYGWRYQDAIAVLAFQAFAHIVALCTAMPLLHGLFLYYLRDSQQANLLTMKVCVMFHLIGTLLIGLSKTPVTVFIAIAISMIGSGFGAAVRSFLTGLVPKHEVALLYTLMSLSASLGTLSGAPLLSFAFSYGISLGGWALGFPFFLATFMYLFCAGFVWSISTRASHIPVADGRRDDV